MNTPAHQAAGLGSGLVQHLQPALHHKVQNFSGETWSTMSVFHFRFTFLLPAGPVAVVSSKACILLQHQGCHHRQLLARARALALTAQPINPHQPKPMPAKHQISHPFPQCPLFRTHSSIIWRKDTKNLSRLWESIFNTMPLPTVSCWPFIPF